MNLFDLGRLFKIQLPPFTMPRVGLNSIIDILVISVVFYYVIIWIKQTRAWTLFQGVGIVLVVSALAYLLELNAVLWIISNMFNVGVIVLVIIFQPELRKALENLGKGRLMNMFRQTSSESSENGALSESAAEAIVDACVKMAKVKTGAIIVIENKVPLGDIESTGIRVDAAITSQLLINTFEKNTPLHDGAVLVRNNRLSAATCILPLTQAPLASELGTRHRASVGASEVSDAMVVVVSEETGAVSIAKEGKLTRDVTREELLERLRAGGGKAGARRSRLWKGDERR